MMRTILKSFYISVARGLAMFLSIFTLLNLAGAWLVTGFDANIWWIDLAFLPHPLGNILLALAAAALLMFALGVSDPPILRALVAIAIFALMLATLRNAAVFFYLWRIGRIHPGMSIPLSIFLASLLGVVLYCHCNAHKASRTRQRWFFAIAFAASLFLFPLAQMYWFGKTDYRRHADAIVVFGARTYADGTMSPVLYDRTRTAIQLYQQHLAPELIFSGGPGDGSTSEPQAMRNLALSMGVPASAILIDEHGLNTESTVANTLPIFAQQHLKTVLAVSHFYHLPRVKMAYARALSADHNGLELLTVPANETAPLPRMPFYMAREIAALWSYYLRPLAGRE